jgi:hypothetical protein
MPYNVSIDVDLTLIDKDGKLLPRVNEAITKLKSADCNITLWSLAGAEYAKSVALKHKIENLFVGFAGKPDIAIDDDLESFNPRLKFEVRPETNWAELVAKVLKQMKTLDGKDGDNQAMLSIVTACQAQFRLLEGQHHANLFPQNRPLHPVPFFGNPFRAEVLTLALNPSYTEFKQDREWSETYTARNLTGKLLAYFDQNPNRWHKWFNYLEKALLCFGSSYETNVAHVDLFPHPTLLQRELTTNNKQLLGSLIQSNSDHLKCVLKLCRSVKLILIIDYPYSTGHGHYAKVFQTLKEHIPAAAQNDGQTFPTFRFSGPNQVADWAFNNRDSIRKHMKDADPIGF